MDNVEKVDRADKFEKMDECFNLLFELYNNKKIKFSWRNNSVGIAFKDIEDDCIKDNEEFKTFMFDFANALKEEALKDKIDDTYHKYTEQLFNCDEDLKSDIITRCNSNIGICNRVGIEVLTKRNQKLEVQCFSALINFVIERPSEENDNEEQVSFELSVRDLKTFQKYLEDTIHKIDKL